jgi:hypothetical protein
MQIRLTRKLADYLDGIDLSDCLEGDVLDAPRRQAELLIAEGWARPLMGRDDIRGVSVSRDRTAAADEPARRPRSVEQLRRAREEMEAHRSDRQERRRAEDKIREELRDSRARTIVKNE